MNVIRAMANAAARRLDVMFPGYFMAAKHNHYRDFGYPDKVTFDMLYAMYTRNGIAAAAVDKTILKTWQDVPFLQEQQRDGTQGAHTKETKAEGEIRQRFEDLRLWSRIAETDRRSLVGSYSGLILRFADGKTFDMPVDRVPGGLAGLVEIIPAWEGQLVVSEWDTEQTSDTYGERKMFQFNEASVGDDIRQPRQFMLHPDRVIIWSRDGTLDCRSLLEAGYNDLMTLEKVSGSGGEGFWKNAKSAPVLEVSPEARIDEMAKAMGVSVDEIWEESGVLVMEDPLTSYGLKASVVIAGFAGGVLRALSHQNYTFREAVASPVCGALAAGYLTSPLVHYLNAIHFPLPPDDGTNVTIHAGAFLVGICAMWISDAIFELISRWIKKQ